MLVFCSASRKVVPSLALRSRTISNTSSTICGARPIEGSSSSSTLGRAISARPMASICCSPPDIVPASCLARSFSRGNSVKTLSMSDSISPSLRL
mmetsp:Transcript_1047/g.2766  ORF Transcript_1047/g.2766 Transcript_1047/m.2766 type:complete len:95 (+) Transcript_1047:2131-2415(+)